MLASADLDQCVHILTLAEQLNLMLMAKSSLAHWEQKVYYFPGDPSEYCLSRSVAIFATHVTFYFYYFCT
jgi:hypothetical protein